MARTEAELRDTADVQEVQRWRSRRPKRNVFQVIGACIPGKQIASLGREESAAIMVENLCYIRTHAR